MIKTFYKYEAAVEFLLACGVEADLVYLNVGLINGRWMVQVPA